MPSLTDLESTEALAPGDACEFRFPARIDWHRGKVVTNGGPSFWRIEDEQGNVHAGLYIEHVRAPGTDPWH